MSTRNPRHGIGRILTAFAAMGLVWSGIVPAGEAVSSSYRLKQRTLNAAGAVSQSAGYRVDFSQAQETTVGTSSSTGYIVQAGFWGAFGSGLVPVILTLDKDSVRSNAALVWSGNNAPYDLYRSADCLNLTSSLLTTIGANSYTETSPPMAPLLCYSVFATAPGPAPPPGGE